MLVFPGSSVGKESACNAGDPGSIPDPGQEVPLEKEEATHFSIHMSGQLEDFKRETRRIPKG